LQLKLIDKINVKKTKRILLVIAIFSLFIPAITANLWFLIPCVISTVLYMYIDEQQDKRSSGRINNEWKRTEFDQIPAIVRKTFLRSIYLDEKYTFLLGSNMYIALFSREHRFAVKEIRNKVWCEEVYITKTSTVSRTVDINGEIFYFELIMIPNASTMMNRKYNFHYLEDKNDIDNVNDDNGNDNLRGRKIKFKLTTAQFIFTSVLTFITFYLSHLFELDKEIHVAVILWTATIVGVIISKIIFKDK
jgi:hypothetical protein